MLRTQTKHAPAGRSASTARASPSSPAALAATSLPAWSKIRTSSAPALDARTNGGSDGAHAKSCSPLAYAEPVGDTAALTRAGPSSVTPNQSTDAAGAASGATVDNPRSTIL
ncbi:hypothetical protein LTR94_036345, partial [Friedmanniomyces endolithicus]